ncbi:MAG: Bcr/CflA family drug resistance efflux transporter [Alphaproteobacteria bacterium]|nr:MAG: Bcr/CflA family drug resistance efflux transporter [Alphaproteobacteria bacterium]
MSHPPSAVLAVVLAALMAVAPFTIDAYLPAMPTLQRALDADIGAVQLTLGLYMIGFAGGQLVIGPWSDRAGRLLPIRVGLLIYIASTLLCAVAWSIETLIAARFLQGLGAGVGPVVVRAMVRDQFDREESARLMSLLSMIFLAAPLVAPFVGGWLLVWTGWRGIFVFLALYGALTLVATHVKVRETLPVERRSTAPWRVVLRDYARLLVMRSFIGYALASSAAFAGMFAYFSGSPFVFIDLYGVPAEWYGALFGIPVVLMVGVNALNRRLIPRYGSERMLSWALVANLVGGLSLAVVGATGWGGLPLLVICLAVYLTPLSTIAANAMAGALEKVPALAGTASALSGALTYGCGALAGFAVGRLHDGSAFAMGVVMAVTGLVASLVYRLVIRPALATERP